MPKLLLVEDEPDLVEPTRATLAASGFTVEVATSGTQALEAASREPPPDLVLLDLMLPDLNGISVCHRLRTDPRTARIPILVVSARGDEYDRVLGFEAGADDYITKPFSLRELALRIRALLRRGGPATGAAPASAPELGRVAADGVLLDAEAYRAWLGGEELDLTLIEFRLLATFLAHRERALTREELCMATWGHEHAISVRAVDTNVKRLRRKLGAAGASLETVRGVGYRWIGRPAT